MFHLLGTFTTNISNFNIRIAYKMFLVGLFLVGYLLFSKNMPKWNIYLVINLIWHGLHFKMLSKKDKDYKLN